MNLEVIQNKIYEIRGQKVMLDYDLAELYAVQTKSLNLSVKRNLNRFPEDFMFQLTNEEWIFLKSQFVTSESLRLQNDTLKRGRGRHTKYIPYAFTEQGLAMLSGILNSEVAINVNISIMRAFVMLRQFSIGFAELNSKLESFMIDSNMQFNDIYVALTELSDRKNVEEQRTQIGYKLKTKQD